MSLIAVKKSSGAPMKGCTVWSGSLNSNITYLNEIS
jgi:hypothetical protein